MNMFEKPSGGRDDEGQQSPGNQPGQMMPGQMMPGQMMPGQMMPGQMMPGQMMPGHMMPGQMIPGQMMPGQMMPGQMMPGHTMPGKMMPGQPAPGEVREARPEGRPLGEVTPAVPGIRPPIGELSAFVQRITEYLADEVSANAFYQQLAGETDNETIRGYLQEAAEDEQKHFRLLSQLYRRLTGRTLQPTPTPVEYSSLREGLLIAENDEIGAYEEYKDEYQRFSDPYLRWLFFELFSDEIEHAVRLNTALLMMAGE